MQSRWRSKAAWLSVLTLIAFVVKQYLGITISDADKLIDLILLAGSSWGIFNNPEKVEGY